MSNLLLSGIITSPITLTTSNVSVLTRTLVTITPSTFSVQRNGPFTYYYYFEQEIVTTDTIFFIRVVDQIFKISPVILDQVCNFNLTIGSESEFVDSLWLESNPNLIINGMKISTVFVDGVVTQPIVPSYNFNQVINSDSYYYTIQNKSLQFNLGTPKTSFNNSWLLHHPIFFAFPSYLPTVTQTICPTGLSFSESNTSLITDSTSEKLIVDWNALSLGTISGSSSLQVGTGILFSFVLRKKTSTALTTNLVSMNTNYIIDIQNDVISVDPLDSGTFYTTTLILTESWQLFSIWIGPTQIKTWLNNNVKDVINYSGSNSPSVNNCVFQFFGYLEKYCIIKTTSPDFSIINNLFTSCGFLSNYSLTGKTFVNGVETPSIPVVLLDSNFRFVASTVSNSTTSIYIFNNLINNNDYYILSSSNDVTNAILGPIKPV